MERMVQNGMGKDQRQNQGLTDQQDKTGAPQSSRPHEQMHFLNIIDPLAAKSMASKKAVRSHVARTTHQKIRRDRVLEYQQCKNAQTQDLSQGDRQSKPDQPRTEERELILRTSSKRYKTAPDIPMPRTFNLAWLTSGPFDILSNGRTDPFQSSAVKLTSFEQYLIDHFVKFVIPQSAAYYPRSKSEPGYQEGMIKYWVPFAITDSGIMNGLFFMACRNLALLYENNSYAREAITYNGKCIRSINEAISKDGKAVSDSTIAKVLLLASAEFHAGNIDGTRNHTDAIGEMVRLKGGLQNLGLEGFLKQLVLWHDRTSTSYIGTSPKFMHAAFFEENASIESLSPGFLDWLDLSLLSIEIINILSDICVITKSANGISLPWNDSDYRTLRLSANEFEVRLLVLSSDYQCPLSSRVYSQIEECLCLSLRVFVSLMPHESSFPPLGCKHLAARIQSLLYKIMLVPSWCQSADLVLWMTFMGAIVARAGTIKGQELAEFFARLRKQVDLPPQTAGGTTDEADFWDLKLAEISSVLGISSKEDIKSHLRRFLWVEKFCERYSGEIWDSLAI